MKPCDCKDLMDLDKMNEAGLGFNEWSIYVEPLSVVISNQTTILNIPMRRFKAFAEWYLEDQIKG